MTKQLLKFEELIEKFNQTKKKNPLDLSSDQDLSIAVMNLISIEEHLFFSGEKTKDTEYFGLITEVREMRKELLGKLVTKSNDGSERWCISKHLLAASMRLMEVGNKQLDMENTQEAYGFYSKAYELYSLFWAINLDLMNIQGIKKIDLEDNKDTKRGVWGKIVQKVIDCCLE